MASSVDVWIKRFITGVMLLWLSSVNYKYEVQCCEVAITGIVSANFAVCVTGSKLFIHHLVLPLCVSHLHQGHLILTSSNLYHYYWCRILAWRMGTHFSRTPLPIIQERVRRVEVSKKFVGKIKCQVVFVGRLVDFSSVISRVCNSMFWLRLFGYLRVTTTKRYCSVCCLRWTVVKSSKYSKSNIIFWKRVSFSSSWLSLCV